MKNLWLILLFGLLSGSQASANAVTVTCTGVGGGTVTGQLSASCTALLPGYGIISVANTAIDLTLSSTGGYNTLHVVENVTDRYWCLGPGNTDCHSGPAATDFNYGIGLKTTGPARNGFVQFSFLGGQPDIVDGSGESFTTLAPWDTSVNPQPFYQCFSHTCTTPSFYLGNQMIPYLLGQSFNLTSSGRLFTYDPNSGAVNLSYGFRFFEADGVTPVALQITPEPGTLTLSGIAAIAALLYRKSVRRLRDN